MDKGLMKLSKQLGKMLKEKNIKIATAESCTGGGIAQAITEVAGSSAWFDRGFVTYSNQAKIEMLHVFPATLEASGAVSEEVAKQMVEGALLNSNANLAVAVTGIAGPSGGSEQKPLGTVYIAWKYTKGDMNCIKQIFSGNRELVRQKTVHCAIKCCLGPFIETDSKL